MERLPNRENPGIPHDVVVRPEEVVVTAKVRNGGDIEDVNTAVYEDSGVQKLRVKIIRENAIDSFVAEMPVKVAAGTRNIETNFTDDGIEIRVRRTGESVKILKDLPAIEPKDTLSPLIARDLDRNGFVFDVDLHMVGNPDVEITPRKEEGTGKDLIDVRISIDNGESTLQTFRFPLPIDVARIKKNTNNGQLEVFFPIKVDNNG